MAQELKLTKAETAAFDRVEAELKGFSARKKIAVLDKSGLADLCKKYHAIKAALLILINFVKKIPVYGAKIAAVLEFLMVLADAVCPA